MTQPTDPGCGQVAWLARVATVGISTWDGRVLDPNPDYTWRLAYPTVPLFVINHQGLVRVGEVNGVFVINDKDMFATGTADPVAVSEVEAGTSTGLFPQLGLDESARIIGGGPALIRGPVGYIALGSVPVFLGTWLRWASWEPTNAIRPGDL